MASTTPGGGFQPRFGMGRGGGRGGSKGNMGARWKKGKERIKEEVKKAENASKSKTETGLTATQKGKVIKKTLDKPNVPPKEVSKTMANKLDKAAKRADPYGVSKSVKTPIGTTVKLGGRTYKKTKSGKWRLVAPTAAIVGLGAMGDKKKTKTETMAAAKKRNEEAKARRRARVLAQAKKMEADLKKRRDAKKPAAKKDNRGYLRDSSGKKVKAGSGGNVRTRYPEKKASAAHKKNLARLRELGLFSEGGRVKAKKSGKCTCRGMGKATRGGSYHK